MKTSLRVFLAVVIFTLAHGILRADSGYSFNFTLQQKKEGGTKKEMAAETIKNQKWSYQVIVENRSFKDVQDMEIKYVMFSKQDEAGRATVVGGQPDLNRHEGSTSIKLLKNNDSVTFNTDQLMLKSVELNDGWYYTNGASSTAKGALRGLWIRVYVGGQMVAEYMDPPNLSDKQTFDPPASN